MVRMLADSPGNRRTIRIIITLLRLYGPLCLGVSVWAFLVRFWPGLSFGLGAHPIHPVLLTVCLLEGLFYAFSLWYAQFVVQAAAIHPPLRTRDERMRLFNKVRAEVHDFGPFIRGWFSGGSLEDIGLDEMRKWLDWAFWEGRAGEGKEKGDDEEIEGYIQRIEQLVGKSFQAGAGKARALRLTLDPIATEPRSLAWYTLIMIADTLAILTLKSKGFIYYRRSLPALATVFPPRPAALYTRNVSPAPSLSYLLRKHTSKTRLPVLYLHGIGIGLLSQVELLDEIHAAVNNGADADDQVGILAVEILQISSRLTTSIPRSAEFVSQLKMLIDFHFGSGRFVLVSHSYGSILSTPIFKDAHLSSRISGALMIDPVSIQLHMPDVAYNFTLRKPVRANEWQLWYFASKDPSIAHTLGRHLFWSECVLWRSQIENLIRDQRMRFTASLSSDDLIVNTRSVKDYLVKAELPTPVTVETIPSENDILETASGSVAKAETWRGEGLEVLWFKERNHAEALDTREDRARLVKVVVEYCSGR